VACGRRSSPGRRARSRPTARRAERDGGEREPAQHARDGDGGGARSIGPVAGRRGGWRWRSWGLRVARFRGHDTIPGRPPPRRPPRQGVPTCLTPRRGATAPSPLRRPRRRRPAATSGEDQHRERRGHRAHPRRRPLARAHADPAAGSGSWRTRARRPRPRRARGCRAARRRGSRARRSRRSGAVIDGTPSSSSIPAAAPPRPGCARRDLHERALRGTAGGSCGARSCLLLVRRAARRGRRAPSGTPQRSQNRSPSSCPVRSRRGRRALRDRPRAGLRDLPVTIASAGRRASWALEADDHVQRLG
jgi:hypothetical protein